MMPLSETEDLGRRPIAWGYIAPPSYYEHAASQWKRQLSELASLLGFVIDRWHEDSAGYTDGLFAMWSQLSGSNVRALFLPHPAPLQHLHTLRGMSFDEIKDSSPIRIYVLSESFAPIQPPRAEPATVMRATSTGRRFSRWRTR